MIRFIVTAALVAIFIWFGATVNLGRRTLFGHIRNIWSSEQAHELREDVKTKTGPALEEAKDRAKAGWHAMQKPPFDAGVADAAP